MCGWVAGFVSYTFPRFWTDPYQIWRVGVFLYKDGHGVISLRVRDQLTRLILIVCHNASKGRNRVIAATHRFTSLSFVSGPARCPHLRDVNKS